MRNQYEGVCYRCGGNVKADAGHFERVTKAQLTTWPNLHAGTKWLTQHAECAVKYRGTDVHFKHKPEALNAATS